MTCPIIPPEPIALPKQWLLSTPMHINIQGDEPFIDPALIDHLAQALEDPQWQMATAVTPITNESEINDPSVVKALFNADGAALYFSRAAIPFLREAQTTIPTNTYWRHIGIYGYRCDFLQKLVQTPPCLLEEAENLNNSRALHIGGRIHMIQTNEFGIGVDTPRRSYSGRKNNSGTESIMSKNFTVNGVGFGNRHPLALIAGPCVVES